MTVCNKRTFGYLWQNDTLDCLKFQKDIKNQYNVLK